VSGKKRIAVMISGRGSNMAALIEASKEASYPAEIVGVISDRPEAPGLIVAQTRGLPVTVVPRRDHPSKEAHDAAIDTALGAREPDIVALAGYMRLLTDDFVERWRGRMVNIHPALLPSFKGLDTHRRALEAGVRVHGCTVHFVTAEVDGGPIIAQAAVPVLASDTEERLAQRVLKAEHQLYPMALAMLAESRVRLERGHAVFDITGTSERNGGQIIVAPELSDDHRNLEDLARFTP
jgi:phosphoribosylglycinamide formyltransferase-1